MKRANSFQSKTTNQIPILGKNSLITKPNQPRSKSLSAKANKKSQILKQIVEKIDINKVQKLARNSIFTSNDQFPTLPMSIGADEDTLKSTWSGNLSPPKPKDKSFMRCSSFSKALDSGTHRLKDLIKASGLQEEANESLNTCLNSSIIDIYGRNDEYDADSEDLKEKLYPESLVMNESRSGKRNSISKPSTSESLDMSLVRDVILRNIPGSPKTPRSALTISKVSDFDCSELGRSKSEELEVTKEPKPIAETTSENNIKPVKLKKAKLAKEKTIAESCPKCSKVGSKIKKQVDEYKSLNKQKKSLDGVLEQKKNLVQELTQQVQTLVKENEKLAKTVEKISNETEQKNKKLQNLTKIRKLKIKKQDTCSLRLTDDKNTTNNMESHNTKHDKLENDIKQLLATCEELKNKLKVTETDSDDLKEFLSDILYTLNARGYESISDGKGKTIDLNKCKAKHLLDLKGRDARATKNPLRKTYLQENLLKAIIGSQEQYIQSLMAQIEKKNQEDHFEDLTTSQGNPRNKADSSGDENFHRDILETEIINTVNLLETICCQNPDVFYAFKQQEIIETAQSGTSNVVLQAVIERCNKHRNLAQGSSKQNRSGSINFPRLPTPPPHCKRTYSAGANEVGLNANNFNDLFDVVRKDSMNQIQGTSLKHPYSTQLKGFVKPSLITTLQPNQKKRSSSCSIVQMQSRSLPSIGSNFFPNLQRNGHCKEQSFYSKKSAQSPRPATMHSTHQQRRGAKCSGSPCHLCGHRFSPNATMSEVNAHLQMHMSTK